MKLNHINHIGVSVRDLDHSIAFYRDITDGKLEFVNDMPGEGLARVSGQKILSCDFVWFVSATSCLN